MRSHHPADAAERVGVVAEDLDEPIQRAKERAEGDAGQQQHGAGRAAAARDRHRVDDAERTGGAGERRDRHGRDAEHRGVDVERDDDNGAERRARRHAERVGRRQRVSQERLEHDAGNREGAADERRRQDARQPCDEEHLGVDVVGEGNRPIEHPRQVDRRAADERRRQADGDGQRAEAGDRGQQTPAEITGRGQAAPRSGVRRGDAS